MSPDCILKLLDEPTGAVFSDDPDRKYRYLLWRWIPQPSLLERCRGICLFHMLNPSTADEKKLDPTVRRALGYATRWGCTSLVVTNTYGWRSTDKRALRNLEDPVGPDNDAWITVAAALADIVVVGWGDGPAGMDITPRVRSVMKLIRRPAVCLGITDAGNPRHPLYRPADFEPIPYTASELRG